MVLIDGHPIREYSLASLRRKIGFVPQTVLFSDRIRENIALGVDSGLTRRSTMLPSANIAADIEGFPEGYETVVGERGITLLADPQGCQVFSFKQPSAAELEHDFCGALAAFAGTRTDSILTNHTTKRFGRPRASRNSAQRSNSRYATS